jgi:hypothetical protein
VNKATGGNKSTIAPPIQLQKNTPEDAKRTTMLIAYNLYSSTPEMIMVVVVYFGQ